MTTIKRKRERDQDQAEILLLSSGLLHTGKPFPVVDDLLKGMMWVVSKKYPGLVISLSSDKRDSRHWVGQRADLVTVGKFRFFIVK